MSGRTHTHRWLRLARAPGQWSAITKVAEITLTPASGTLQPGASQTIAISGTTSSAFTIFFPGTPLSVTITCT